MCAQRLFHDVAAKIAELIDGGTFPPGTRLPAERALAEKFAVSRVTIREAVIALQALGRVDVKTGSGIYVCEKQPGIQASLPDVTAFDLTEARSLFEAEGAALAAVRISDEDLDALQRLIEKMSSDDDAESTAADQAFHESIARASGNGVIEHVVTTLWRMRVELPKVRDMYEAVCEHDADSRSTEHQDILDALRARDAVGARNAMRRHFQRLLGTMLDTSEERAMQKVRLQLEESRSRFMNLAELH